MKQRDARNTTMMLIVIIAIFLSTEIPFMVITILHVLSTSLVKLLDYELAGNICLIINAIICFFFPLNFAIYCGMSKDFRDTFTVMFLQCFSLFKRWTQFKVYNFTTMKLKLFKILERRTRTRKLFMNQSWEVENIWRLICRINLSIVCYVQRFVEESELWNSSLVPPAPRECQTSIWGMLSCWLDQGLWLWILPEKMFLS